MYSIEMDMNTPRWRMNSIHTKYNIYRVFIILFYRYKNDDVTD